MWLKEDRYGWFMIGWCCFLSVHLNIPPKWVGAMYGYTENE